MAGEFESRVYRFVGRYGTVFNIVGWICFALVCADYARFIELPDIVTLPAAIGGILMGARYAIWHGVIVPRFQRETSNAAIEDKSD